MQDIRALIMEKVTAQIASTRRVPVEMSEETRLFDLGLDSMGIITTLLMLETEVGLDLDRMAGATAPKTLGDLVEMAAAAVPQSAPQPEPARSTA